jgi:hypothetical protein
VSGTRPESAEGRLTGDRLAEQHLGDRLAALVDGELGHDTRERVLAHVATCPKCKAEVDAQRRLKNVFAQAAPPPPSESFLARLQGLPGGGPMAGDRDDGGLPPLGGGLGDGVFGMRRGERLGFDYLPAAGFRIHDVGRQEAERAAASRGRRFAFVAAGAVSLAAIALGGVTTGTPGDTDTRGGSGSGSNVTPVRSPGSHCASSGARSPRCWHRARADGPSAVRRLPHSCPPRCCRAAPGRRWTRSRRPSSRARPPCPRSYARSRRPRRSR